MSAILVNLEYEQRLLLWYWYIACLNRMDKSFGYFRDTHLNGVFQHIIELHIPHTPLAPNVSSCLCLVAWITIVRY